MISHLKQLSFFSLLWCKRYYNRQVCTCSSKDTYTPWDNLKVTFCVFINFWNKMGKKMVYNIMSYSLNFSRVRSFPRELTSSSQRFLGVFYDHVKFLLPDLKSETWLCCELQHIFLNVADVSTFTRMPFDDDTTSDIWKGMAVFFHH